MDISLIQWATQFGLATAIAIYFIIWTTNHLKNKLDRIEMYQKLINERLNDIKELLKELLEELRKRK